MKRFTVSIPKEMKNKLDSLPNINWAQVAKEGILEKIKELEEFEKFKNRGE